ncbi:MAG TPA: hypothetical protein VMI10_12410 [Terriglobales bacterium]|nr:hypothetical protein [Terriglobales bacterium]
MPPTDSLAANKPSHTLTRHVALWIFASFQFLYLLTSTGRVRTADEYNTLYTTESLVLHGTTAVPQAVALHNFYGRFDVHGLPRAAYPPGQALACAPWYALGQYVLARLPGVPPDDTDLIVAFASSLSSATFAALSVTFFFLLLSGIGVALHPALLATFMVGLATPIFAYSGWLFSEPLSAAIFTGVACLLFTAAATTRTAAIAGLLLGLATLVRPTNILAIGIFALALLAHGGRAAVRTAFVLCAASAIGVFILLVHNAILFGNPFAFGYPAAAEGAKQLNRFDTPLLTGLYGFLLSPGKSIFIFAPPIILALAGLASLWRNNRGLAALAIVFPLIGLLFFSKYSQWEGGYCVGPRYLVPALIFLCLGLGPVLARRGIRLKALVIALFALGFLVQALSLATSFMEDQVPRGHYYGANWTYRLDYSLSGPIHFFWKYLNSSEPARLGLGWDRWFVFLAKAGVSRAALAVFGAAMLAGLAVSLLGLSKSVATAE